MSDVKLRVLFRVDASIRIGSGHIMRCLTLADELRGQGHDCRFVCREHPGHLCKLVTSRGYEVNLLSTSNENFLPQNTDTGCRYADWLGVSWQQDARQTRKIVDLLKPDWLVVDHYALDAEWECSVSSGVGKIMVIDDLANRRHECAVLLD